MKRIMVSDRELFVSSWDEWRLHKAGEDQAPKLRNT